MNTANNGFAAADDNDVNIQGFPNAGNQYVTFTLDREEYGLDILQVQEIIGYRKMTRIPNVSDAVSGILNLRGAIVPVIDLRKKFGLPSISCTESTVIVIVVVHDRTMGIIVDAVSDVVSFLDSEIRQPPQATAGIRTEFFSGMGQKDDKLAILMNLGRLLSCEEMGGVDNVVH